ncbi:MAG: response regulator [Bacteroidetes bacterium]|jgi:CheY-like chemotaxis protein|nr:response regulator [Bacteroidota bacterium]
MESQKTPLRILLTDDDEGDRLVFQEIFEEMETDTSVWMVNDGKQLMGFLTDPKNPLPHIIFLDLNMPDMNGIECLKEIRSDETYRDISIAIYSTSTFEKDIEETFRHGANIYITKPGDYNELKQVLTKALTAVRLRRESEFDSDNFVLRV